ncbi:MAG: S8 family serine peptidase [Pseudomonadota bacterium]
MPPLPALPAPREGREPGQIVVYFATADEADAALAALRLRHQLEPNDTTPLVHLGGVIAVFQLPTQAAATAMREQLRKEFPTAVVDFNMRYRPLLQSTVQPRIYLPQKVDQPMRGSGVPPATGIRIGIVDGPVARSAALLGVNIQRRSFLAGTDTAAPATHATSIAALIAGQDSSNGFVGIAPRAQLVSAEIMHAIGPDDLTSSATLIRALDWLLAEKVHIINLSLGGPGDMVMEKAFSRLTALGLVVVAAGGNGGPDAAPAYPAAYPGVIAVTATDAADRLYVQATRGSYITLAAPGVDLWVPDGVSGRYVSGTSFSAAIVSGASALLLAQSPQTHARSMAQRLCRGARDLGARGADAAFGCGLLQISTALREDRS